MSAHEFLHGSNRLVYTVDGDGPPIVFLHNGGASRDIWVRQVDELRDRYQVICLDLLGFGESDMPETGYTIDHYVETLSDFIDHLDVGPVSIASNCMGSAMALLLAQRRPEVLNAIVAINPLTERTARRGVIGLVLPLVARMPTLSLAVARRVRVPGWLTHAVVVAQYAPQRWWSGLRNPLPGARSAGAGWTKRGRLTALAELFIDLDGLAAVDRIVPGPDFPPLAVVWGDSNLGLSPRAGRTLNRTLNPRRAEFLSGCGHLPMMEEPEAVSAIIDEFVGATR